MKLFGKEKEVVDLILRHCAKTGEVLVAANDILRRTIEGSDKPDGQDARRVRHLEEEADQMLREARELMYSGAYLPLVRADIYRLLSRVDDVANMAEQSCDVACLQNPDIPDQYHEKLLAILDLTADCFAQLSCALAQYVDRKGDTATMRQHMHRVNKLESDVDHNGREITHELFLSGIPKAEKLHIQLFLNSIISISDATEDAADALDLVAVKSIV